MSARSRSEALYRPPDHIHGNRGGGHGAVPPVEASAASLGRRLKNGGLRPGRPVVLVPGLASSALEQVAGPDDWNGTRLWLAMDKLAMMRLRAPTGGACPDRMSDDADRSLPGAPRWLRTMQLDESLRGDCPNVRVRAVPGITGCDYLAPSNALTQQLSYVMGPLVRCLREVGYTDNMLSAATYDWRLTPIDMEYRDGYFSQLAHTLERNRALHREATVIVAHSMGGLVVQEFLKWAQRVLGRQWIDFHVHAMLAMSVPWLGTPKALRGLVSGYRIGLEAFIPNHFGAYLGRATAALYTCLPRHMELHPHVPFAVLDGTPYPDFREVLEIAGLTHGLQLLEELQEQQDDSPPPLKRLMHIYGIGVCTEVAYEFRSQTSSASPTPFMSLDRRGNLGGTPHGSRSSSNTRIHRNKSEPRVRRGRVVESMETNQPIQEVLGEPPRSVAGDGLVPYASLAYYRVWRDSISEMQTLELRGVEHRALLSNLHALEAVVRYVSDDSGMEKNEPTEDTSSQNEDHPVPTWIFNDTIEHTEEWAEQVISEISNTVVRP